MDINSEAHLSSTDTFSGELDRGIVNFDVTNPTTAEPSSSSHSIAPRRSGRIRDTYHMGTAINYREDSDTGSENGNENEDDMSKRTGRDDRRQQTHPRTRTGRGIRQERRWAEGESIMARGNESAAGDDAGSAMATGSTETEAGAMAVVTAETRSSYSLSQHGHGQGQSTITLGTEARPYSTRPTFRVGPSQSQTQPLRWKQPQGPKGPIVNPVPTPPPPPPTNTSSKSTLFVTCHFERAAAAADDDSQSSEPGGNDARMIEDFTEYLELQARTIQSFPIESVQPADKLTAASALLDFCKGVIVHPSRAGRGIETDPSERASRFPSAGDAGTGATRIALGSRGGAEGTDTGLDMDMKDVKREGSDDDLWN